ncbi:calpain-3 isoform X4 [Hypanus sabinus]|uniref:calpain-3 isoform X4 n=1 Tax=Hypanus sabinus TaxID=79690 RepID=UPI0028C3E4FA|nr:calpain-3 isoform X4 [Hypanus sabinus]
MGRLTSILRSRLLSGNVRSFWFGTGCLGRGCPTRSMTLVLWVTSLFLYEEGSGFTSTMYPVPWSGGDRRPGFYDNSSVLLRNANCQHNPAAPKPPQPRPGAGLFEDPHFPADNSSLHGPGRASRFNLAVSSWKRPQEICASPQFVVEGTTRADICQGALGDCWFLSVIACLSLNKDVMKQVIPANQGFGTGYSGCFCFKFWQYGRWVEVIVDDRLPTVDNKLAFLYSRNNNEFWSPLLEKAYAKLKGCYESLYIGYPLEAMVDLTGGAPESLQIDEMPKDLWKFLKKLLDKGSIVCCAKPGPVGVLGEQGIVTGHAYSVTGVDKVQLKAGRVELVRVRNPWGRVEWSGAWSDRSAEWNQVSEQHRPSMAHLEDGEFWMSIEDFKKIFSCVEICHLSLDLLSNPEGMLKPWVQMIYEGRWIRGFSAGGNLHYKDKYYWMNPQFKLTLLEEDDDSEDPEVSCTFLVVLMQKHRRRMQLTGVNFLYIGFDIFQGDPAKAFLTFEDLQRAAPLLSTKEHRNASEVMLRGRLPPGHYIIIPSTANPNEEGEFLLRVFTEKGNLAKPVERNTSAAETPRASAGVQPDLIHCPLPPAEDSRELFNKYSGPDEAISALELQKLLAEILQKTGLSEKWDQFGLDACRSLISLTDNHGFGKMRFEGFSHLWTKICHWTQVFIRFDKNGSGTMDSQEMFGALQAAGFQMDEFLMQLIGLRYTDPDLTLSYVNFICCLTKLDTMIRAFRTLDKFGTGVVNIGYKEWLQMTMYS